MSWNTVKLSHVCSEDKTIATGKLSSNPYLGLEMIESETGRINWTENNIEGISTCYSFDSRHILYGKLRPYLNKVALPEIEGRCSTEIIPLLPNPDVCREYIAFLLRRKETIDYVMPENTGSRMPRADMSHLLNMGIHLPPSNEQRHIIAEIERQLAIVEKAKQAAMEQLASARELNAAYLRKVFKGNQWNTVELGQICEITSSKRVFESDWTKSGVPFYRAREIVQLANKGFVENGIFISNELYEELSEKYGFPQEGDILVTGVGTLGISYLVKQNDKFYFKDGNIIWLKNLDKSVNPKYLRFLFETEFIKNQIESFSAGGTVGTYTIINAKKTVIPLPPCDEQYRIVERLEMQYAKANKMIIVIQSQLDVINAMPAAILRQAFSRQL